MLKELEERTPSKEGDDSPSKEDDDSQSKEGCGFDVKFIGDEESEKEPINRDQLIEYVHEYFENLYDTETDDQGGIISYNPKIIKILAEGMVSGVLSPVIESVLEIGSTFQCLNKNYGTYIEQELDNSLFIIEPPETEEEAATKADASAAGNSSGESSPGIGREPIFGTRDKADGLYNRLLDKIEISFRKIFGDLNKERTRGIFKVRGLQLQPISDIESNFEQLSELLFSQKDNSEPSKNASISEIEDTIIKGLYGDRVFFLI